ncbi:hypothetical protein B0H66DRAFT_319962 [Apodospora peruviana]|uniref:Secreted protein n=1 Tax=Apodospora peruviana TaxID=516989 RepID=A0AAE0HXJ8_9PEZI|nr:hypothetical protein B0H66DRAFT_319962 [Apodospora peruviana]
MFRCWRYLIHHPATVFLSLSTTAVEPPRTIPSKHGQVHELAERERTSTGGRPQTICVPYCVAPLSEPLPRWW